MEIDRPVLYLISMREVTDEIKYTLQSASYDTLSRFNQYDYMKHILNELNEVFMDIDSRPISHAVACLKRIGVAEDLARYISLEAFNSTIDAIAAHLPSVSFREISKCDFTQPDENTFGIIIYPSIFR